jgi:hypothetical protein
MTEHIQDPLPGMELDIEKLLPHWVRQLKLGISLEELQREHDTIKFAPCENCGCALWKSKKDDIGWTHYPAWRDLKNRFGTGPKCGNSVPREDYKEVSEWTKGLTK